MNIETGSHVVCIDGKFHPKIKDLYDALPSEGESYVIRDMRLGIQLDCKTGDVSVLLVGVSNPKSLTQPFHERGFSIDRFVPLGEFQEACKGLREEVKEMVGV